MPAFASFARTQIRDSELLKSLRLLMENHKLGKASAEWSFDSLERSKSTKRYFPTTMAGRTKLRVPLPTAVKKKQPEIGIMETALDQGTEIGSRKNYDRPSQVNIAVARQEVGLEEVSLVN
jgi:hypothetical protein